MMIFTLLTVVILVEIGIQAIWGELPGSRYRGLSCSHGALTLEYWNR
jgi:hypothetical protein